MNDYENFIVPLLQPERKRRRLPPGTDVKRLLAVDKDLAPPVRSERRVDRPLAVARELPPRKRIAYPLDGSGIVQVDPHIRLVGLVVLVPDGDELRRFRFRDAARAFRPSARISSSIVILTDP